MKKLQSLLSKGVVKSYQGAQRPWMQDVNEEEIYASIATKEHEALVDAIVADALGQSYSIAG